METLISAAGQLRSRSWRKCADIIGRIVLKFHERSRPSNFIFLAHFHLLFTLSMTLTALQALFLATFQKTTPEDPTSSYILDMYRVSKYMSYLTDFHFPSAVGNINDISNGLKVYFLLYKVT